MKNPFHIIAGWFKKPTANSIAAQKLAQAEILAMQHLEATNFHGHQHQFYTHQIEVLKQQLGHYGVQKVDTATVDLTSMPIPINTAPVRRRRVTAAEALA